MCFAGDGIAGCLLVERRLSLAGGPLLASAKSLTRQMIVNSINRAILKGFVKNIFSPRRWSSPVDSPVPGRPVTATHR